MVKNRYIYHSRISEAKCREILRLFSIDLNATQISELTNISRNSINKILKALRVRIAMLCEQDRVFDGEVEVDESFFGAKRVKGKRGRGAYGKTIVFGIYKRNGKVYTRIIPNCSRDTLQEIIKGKVNLNSTIHSDNWKGYDGLVDLGYKKHYRLDHSKDEFVRGSSHINGIEGFWDMLRIGYLNSRECIRITFTYTSKKVNLDLIIESLIYINLCYNISNLTLLSCHDPKLKLTAFYQNGTPQKTVFFVGLETPLL